MRTTWSDLEFSATLTQLDGGWVLLRLAEPADFLLGLNARSQWKGQELPAGSKQFDDKLQVCSWAAGLLGSGLSG